MSYLIFASACAFASSTSSIQAEALNLSEPLCTHFPTSGHSSRSCRTGRDGKKPALALEPCCYVLELCCSVMRTAGFVCEAGGEAVVGRSVGKGARAAVGEAVVDAAGVPAVGFGALVGAGVMALA